MSSAMAEEVGNGCPAAVENLEEVKIEEKAKETSAVEGGVLGDNSRLRKSFVPCRGAVAGLERMAQDARSASGSGLISSAPVFSKCLVKYGGHLGVRRMAMNAVASKMTANKGAVINVIDVGGGTPAGVRRQNGENQLYLLDATMLTEYTSFSEAIHLDVRKGQVTGKPGYPDIFVACETGNDTFAIGDLVTFDGQAAVADMASAMELDVATFSSALIAGLVRTGGKNDREEQWFCLVMPLLSDSQGFYSLPSTSPGKQFPAMWCKPRLLAVDLGAHGAIRETSLVAQAVEAAAGIFYDPNSAINALKTTCTQEKGWSAVGYKVPASTPPATLPAPPPSTPLPASLPSVPLLCAPPAVSSRAAEGTQDDDMTPHNSSGDGGDNRSDKSYGSPPEKKGRVKQEHAPVKREKHVRTCTNASKHAIPPVVADAAIPMVTAGDADLSDLRSSLDEVKKEYDGLREAMAEAQTDIKSILGGGRTKPKRGSQAVESLPALAKKLGLAEGRLARVEQEHAAINAKLATLQGTAAAPATVGSRKKKGQEVVAAQQSPPKVEAPATPDMRKEVKELRERVERLEREYRTPLVVPGTPASDSSHGLEQQGHHYSTRSSPQRVLHYDAAMAQPRAVTYVDDQRVVYTAAGGGYHRQAAPVTLRTALDPEVEYHRHAPPVTSRSTYSNSGQGTAFVLTPPAGHQQYFDSESITMVPVTSLAQNVVHLQPAYPAVEYSMKKQRR
eukprot:jgi/Mesvir1/3619/Mv26056-RA.1